MLLQLATQFLVWAVPTMVLEGVTTTAVTTAVVTGCSSYQYCLPSKNLTIENLLISQIDDHITYGQAM